MPQGAAIDGMQVPAVPAVFLRQVKPDGHGVVVVTQFTGMQYPF